MSKKIVENPILSIEATVIKKAVLTYARFMKVPAIENGKRVMQRMTDFTLGDLAKAIRKNLTNKDLIVKETLEVLSKHKNDVVAYV